MTVASNASGNSMSTASTAGVQHVTDDERARPGKVQGHSHRCQLHFKGRQEDSLYREVLVGLHLSHEKRTGDPRYRYR